MTESGFPRRLRSRRVALAAAGTGAAVIAAATVALPTETVASFADNVWAGAGFSAGSFEIESSETYDGDYSSHGANSPLVLEGSPDIFTVSYSTPITLTPGGVSYAPVYLRTSPETANPATVTLEPPQQRGGEYASDPDLWNTYVTFSARAVPATGTQSCRNYIFNENVGTELFSDRSLNSTALSTTSFPLLANAESKYMVCFRFTLKSDVVTGSPTSNGKSVHPVWTFEGVQA